MLPAAGRSGQARPWRTRDKFQPMRPALLLLLGATAATGACSRPNGSASCGIASLTGPLVVKESFARGNVLTNVPDFAPGHLPVRLVAGPAWRGTVAKDSTGGWRITTEGTVSRTAHVGYGVLVLDTQDAPLGVLAFDGRAVPGAIRLGSLVIADTVVPLLGVRIAAPSIQDPRCPVFPDSLR